MTTDLISAAPRQHGTRRSAMLAAGAGLAVSALGASLFHASPVAAKAPKNPPCVVWTDDSGNAKQQIGNGVIITTTTNVDAADLIQGWMQLSPDGKTLVVKLTVAKLNSDPKSNVPAGATEVDWFMNWTLDSSKYFAHASVDVRGNTTFGDGTPSSLPGGGTNYADAHSDGGSFTSGDNGVVEIDVPAAHVGHPSAGSLIDTPTGQTYTGTGVPGVAAYFNNANGPVSDQSYLVGKGCVASSSSGNAVRAHATGTASTPTHAVQAVAAMARISAQTRRMIALNED